MNHSKQTWLSIFDKDRFHLTIFVYDFEYCSQLARDMKRTFAEIFTLLTVNAPIFRNENLLTFWNIRMLSPCLVVSRRDSYYQFGKYLLESYTRTNCRTDQQNTSCVITWRARSERLIVERTRPTRERIVLPYPLVDPHYSPSASTFFFFPRIRERERGREAYNPCETLIVFALTTLIAMLFLFSSNYKRWDWCNISVFILKL